MKYIITGFVTGAIFSLFFLQGKTASGIVPVFYSEISNITMSVAEVRESPIAQYLLVSSDFAALIDEQGRVRKSVDTGQGLFEFSGNGSFFTRYSSTGNEIELFGISGEPYWKLNSRGKPLLSQNGSLIFLITSDHSSIKIIDKNGRDLAVGSIHGRLCTAAGFSAENDYGAAGFADGSFYFLNDSGDIIYSGMAGDGAVVKGINISNNGIYGSVHYGDSEKDFIKVVDIRKRKEKVFQLSQVHYVKTSISVSDDGHVVFLDMDNLLALNSSGRIRFRIDLPSKKPGFSALSVYDGILSLSYTGADGFSRFYLLNDRGTILYSADFSDESFLDSKIVNDYIFLRGSRGLSVHNFFRGDM